MREIKFRVWSNTKNSYLDNSDYQVSCDDGEIYESVGVPLTSHLSAGIVTTHNLIIEQYTGLKDKNGVEIYEGDIVMTNLGEHTVEWLQEELCFKLDILYFDEVEIIYEVIGNIHEKGE